MRFWRRALVGAIVVGIAIAGLSYGYWDQTVLIGSMALNYMSYWSAPAGTLETEVAQTAPAAQTAPTASALPQVTPSGTAGDWPSYNKNSHVEPLLGVKSDQQDKRREAQSSLHL